MNIEKTLETERLILRPWNKDDAERLYEYAKDPRIGSSAGFPPHTSVENSREVIKNVLAVPGTYAVTLKSDPQGRAVGSISIDFEKKEIENPEAECEIGYWIGVPFWGNGYIPEAVRELQRYSFEVLGLEKIWCAYFDGNEKSKRVQEKCGFKYHHSNVNVFWKLLDKTLTEHVTVITKDEWKNTYKG